MNILVYNCFDRPICDLDVVEQFNVDRFKAFCAFHQYEYQFVVSPSSVFKSPLLSQMVVIVSNIR